MRRIFFQIILLILCVNSEFVHSDEIIKKNNLMRFDIFIEKEFLSHKIRTFRDKNNVLGILDSKNNEYHIKFELIKKNESSQNYLPLLTVKEYYNEIKISVARGLTFNINDNVLEIENVSKLLVKDTLINLIARNITFSKFDNIISDNFIKKINLTLIGFDYCERSEILKNMETQFPNFFHVEIISSNLSKSKYKYYTKTTINKIQSWSSQLMFSYGFNSKEFFIKVNKNNVVLKKSKKKQKIGSCS